MNRLIGNTAKGLFYALLLCVSLGGVTLSARWTLAGLAEQQVEQELLAQQWSAATPPPAETRLALQRTLERSLGYKPGNADTWRMLGQLYEAQLMADGRSNWAEAIPVYREAVLHRPTWPDDWVRLAWAKAANNELDEEFLLALQRALGLGETARHMELSLRYLAPLGRSMVDDPNTLFFLMTDTFIMRGLQGGGNYQNKLDILEQAGLLATYCTQLPVMTTPQAVRDRCNAAGSPAQ